MTIEFGGFEAENHANGSSGRLRLPLARLDGECVERVLPSLESAQMILGWILQPIGESVADTAQEAYRRLLGSCAGYHLCRIWNYVPDINGARDGLENYQAFNVGRAAAFVKAFGAGYRSALPAGSAVGCHGGSIGIVFAASREMPRHFENPEQVPAYDYPPEHGPRPPCFCRATTTRSDGRRLVFISGTAAIKGHGTVAPESFGDQVDCTLDNLRLISRQAGAGDDLGASAGFERHLKIYLRHPGDLEAARARLRGELIREGDSVIWLQTDLCRRALRVEIEATLIELT